MTISDMLTLAFFQGIGTTEVLVIFFLILLLFGAKKLPELAKGMGKAMHEFKRASSEIEDEVKSAIDTDTTTAKKDTETKKKES